MVSYALVYIEWFHMYAVDVAHRKCQVNFVRLVFSDVIGRIGFIQSIDIHIRHRNVSLARVLRLNDSTPDVCRSKCAFGLGGRTEVSVAAAATTTATTSTGHNIPKQQPMRPFNAGR